MEKALKALELAGRENGLELSEEKTKILRIRGPKIEGKIGKYKVENKAKYFRDHNRFEMQIVKTSNMILPEY